MFKQDGKYYEVGFEGLAGQPKKLVVEAQSVAVSHPVDEAQCQNPQSIEAIAQQLIEQAETQFQELLSSIPTGWVTFPPDFGMQSIVRDIQTFETGFKQNHSSHPNGLMLRIPSVPIGKFNHQIRILALWDVVGQYGPEQERHSYGYQVRVWRNDAFVISGGAEKPVDIPRLLEVLLWQSYNQCDHFQDYRDVPQSEWQASGLPFSKNSLVLQCNQCGHIWGYATD